MSDNDDNENDACCSCSCLGLQWIIKKTTKHNRLKSTKSSNEPSIVLNNRPNTNNSSFQVKTSELPSKPEPNLHSSDVDTNQIQLLVTKADVDGIIIDNINKKGTNNVKPTVTTDHNSVSTSNSNSHSGSTSQNHLQQQQQLLTLPAETRAAMHRLSVKLDLKQTEKLNAITDSNKSTNNVSTNDSTGNMPSNASASVNNNETITNLKRELDEAIETNEMYDDCLDTISHQTKCITMEIAMSPESIPVLILLQSAVKYIESVQQVLDETQNKVKVAQLEKQGSSNNNINSLAGLKRHRPSSIKTVTFTPNNNSQYKPSLGHFSEADYSPEPQPLPNIQSTNINTNTNVTATSNNTAKASISTAGGRKSTSRHRKSRTTLVDGSTDSNRNSLLIINPKHTNDNDETAPNSADTNRLSNRRESDIIIQVVQQAQQALKK